MFQNTECKNPYRPRIAACTRSDTADDTTPLARRKIPSIQPNMLQASDVVHVLCLRVNRRLHHFGIVLAGRDAHDSRCSLRWSRIDHVRDFPHVLKAVTRCREYGGEPLAAIYDVPGETAAVCHVVTFS